MDSDLAELVQHYIGGTLTSGASPRRADVFDPATGQVARRWRSAPRADVDAAVAGGAAAFPAWAATTPLTRARVMFRFRDLLDQQRRPARRHHHRRARQGAVGREAAR